MKISGRLAKRLQDATNLTSEELQLSRLVFNHLPNRYLTKGPGDFLHDAILKWVGEGPTRECGCKDRIAKMNAWGPAGCREHLDEIVEWMMGEAQKRGWWKVAVAVPILPRIFIRQMILGAIAESEKATA